MVKLDWRQLANNSYSTYDVATAVVPRLMQTNFIAEMNGHALAGAHAAKLRLLKLAVTQRSLICATWNICWPGFTC